ncbi:toll-like receptor 2 [Babylonia areolata]|uniref:toll-like receptor 2 n=1 Tax=Babylonia areolata TaxID=304850 RepID=UPI003FD3F5A4
MARPMAHSVWWWWWGWLCPLVVVVVVVGVAVLSEEMPCGDGLCLCDVSIADCSGHEGTLPYVPSFPDHIRIVNLSRNGLSSQDLASNNFLVNVTHIRSLELTYNSITWLSRDMFDGMENLETLGLDGNEALDLESLKEIFSIPTLISVGLEKCNLPPPPVDLFQNGTYSIEYIVLSSNPHGGTYSLDGFCPFQDLSNLKLHHCDFNNIASSCPLHLYELDMADNSLRTFPRTCMMGNESIFPELTTLILRHNRIETLSTAEVCIPYLMRLDLSYNFIKVFSAGTFCANKFPYLEELRLQHQSRYQDLFRRETRIEDNAFNNDNLRKLYLHGNALGFANRENIGKWAFTNCFRIEILDLSSNNFTYVDDQRFLELFLKMFFLKELHLADSKLESISERTFAHFNQLNTLRLENNMISDVPDGTFDSLYSLRWLSLQNNKIKSINEHTFSKDLLDGLFHFEVGFNPFLCSCDLRWFARWFQSRQSSLFKGQAVQKSYKCYNSAGTATTTLAEFFMADQACLLSQEASLLLIQTCSIFIASLLLVSLLFRYRWYIRLLMYEVFRGRDALRRQRLQADDFDFDVFVSYAAPDLPWVRGHLLAKLEGEMGLRLCVHERDFLPGNNIVDNIVQCVEKSKKVLMVFSRHFVRSQWCQFELSLCLSHVLDYDDALIVVCVDDVTSRHVATSAMMAVLKTTTYIQWRGQGDGEGEEEPGAEAAFWGRLRLALEEILPHHEHPV